MVDLQAPGKVFATLDYSETPPLVFVGEQVRFDDLKLTRLRAVMPVGWEPDAGIQAQSFQCPGCGGALTIRARVTAKPWPAAPAVRSSISRTRIFASCQIQGQDHHEPQSHWGRAARWKAPPIRQSAICGAASRWKKSITNGASIYCFTVSRAFAGWWNTMVIWSLVHTLTEPPLVTGYAAKAKAVYQDQSYRRFQTARPRSVMCAGRVYWRVRVGERCEISDYIAPPFQLSQERTDKEIVWSQAEYIEPDAIRTAFRLETPPPLRMGIAPNQPSPYDAQRPKIRRLLGVFLALLVIGKSSPWSCPPINVCINRRSCSTRPPATRP